MEKLVFSVAEAASVLGVSRPTLYRILERPDFPKVRVGSRIVIPRNLFISWLEKEAGGYSGD